MWPFKSKYDKLTREEVVTAICNLENESKQIEDGIAAIKLQIEDLTAKGKAETDRSMKLYYAKKINAIKAEREQSVQRLLYIMYNVQLLTKLKAAIDDNQMFKNTTKMSLANLLADQKGLAKFLNKALGTRIAAEDVLTSADETFRTISESYEPSSEIYGMNEQDDALLAMFEQEEQVAAEEEAAQSETPQTLGEIK